MRKAIIITLSLIACLGAAFNSSAQEMTILCISNATYSGTGTLIKGSNGTVVLMDEGGGSGWAGLCKEVMDNEGINYIDYAIATHYDSDHIGGLDDLNNLMGGDSASGYAPNFGAFLDRGGSKRDDDTAIPADYYDFVTASHKRETVQLNGSSDIDLGSGASIRFLSVGATDGTAEIFIRGRSSVTTGVSENNKSISALCSFPGSSGGFDMYIGGDLEGNGEKAVDDVIVQDLGAQVDVMLVDHHGADTYAISSDEFLGNISPEVALISCWNNAFGHPRYNTIVRLQNVVEPDNQRIIRTSAGDPDDPAWAPENMSYCHTTEGTIKITAGGNYYTVSGNGINDNDLVNHIVDELAAGPPSPTPPPATPPAAPTPPPGDPSAIVVNQVCPLSAPGEYVELYNNSGAALNLSGWKLNVYSNDYTFTSSDVIPAGGFYLISDTSPVSGTTADVTTDINITDNSTSSYAQLLDASSEVVDTVGWSKSILYEGGILGRASAGKVWCRDVDGVDSDNNVNDFSAVAPNPRNSGGAPPPPTPPPAATPTPPAVATPTPPAVATPTPDSGASTMSVNSIVCSLAGGKRKKGNASVIVLNDVSAPVASANVTGTFTGTYNESVTAATDGSGVATLTTKGAVNDGGSFNFCVNNVTHASLIYSPGDNVETCDSY